MTRARVGASLDDFLGGDVRIWRSDGRKFGAIEAYESVFAYRFKMYIEKQGYSGTGNLAVRRADFARVGPFRGLEVAEDVEWGSTRPWRPAWPFATSPA